MAPSTEEIRRVLRTIEPRWDRKPPFGTEIMPNLEALAKDADEHVAQAAVRMAVVLDREAASALVEHATSSASVSVRLAAATCLQSLAGIASPSAIVNALTDEDIGVRRQALISASSWVGEPVVVDAVRSMATSEVIAIRDVAAAILPTVTGKVASPVEVEATLKAGKPSAVDIAALGAGALEHLVSIAAGGTADVAAAAVHSSRYISTAAVQQVLDAATRNPDLEVRLAAEQAVSAGLG